MIDVAPGTIVVFSDIGCPWAHIAVYRLLATRRKLGLDARVTLDHRAFPLEVYNRRPTPKRILDAEVAVVGGLEPDAGMEMWQDEEQAYPVTTLLALEAVQAAKEQGLRASEELDLALREAFFSKSQCVSLRHVILEVAEKCEGVDAEALRDAIDHGRARRAVFDQAVEAEREHVEGSPHFFLVDGSDAHNPGIEQHWTADKGRGVPVVTRYEPDVYEDLLRRAVR
jgi:predicted DsbA family dithiol-disulfide isomerase